jgi:hypothetical protein
MDPLRAPVGALLAFVLASIVLLPRATAQRDAPVAVQIAALDRISEASISDPLRRRAHLSILAREVARDEHALAGIDRSEPLGLVVTGGAFLGGGVAAVAAFIVADALADSLCPRSLFRCENDTPEWLMASMGVAGGVALLGVVLLVVGGGPLREANTRIARLRPRIERERYWLDIFQHIDASVSAEGGTLGVTVPF